MSGAMKMSEGLQASTSGEMGTSEMETEEYYNPEGGEEWSQKVDTGQLCRVCANPNEYLIPIFDGEGLEHELSVKIEKHLPIKVTDTDTLPRHMCYQCASTLIAWHDLVNCCIEADKKLRELQAEEEEIEDDFDKGAEMFEPHSVDDSEAADEVDQPSTSEVQKQESRVPSPKKTAPSKRPKLTMVLVKGNSAGSSGLKTAAAAKSPVAKSPELAKSKDGANQDTSAERCQIPSEVFQEHLTADYTGINLQLDTELVKSEGNAGNEEIGVVENLKTELGNGYLFPSDTDNNLSTSDSEDESLMSIVESSTLLWLGKKIVPLIDRQMKPLTEQQKKERTCEYCGKFINNKTHMEQHRRTHLGIRPFICHICGKQCSKKSFLTAHIISVHDKVKNHECDVCGAKFSLKSYRDNHRRIHTGERPYVCEECGKCFATPTILYCHKRIHRNYFPHTCSYCGKKFRTRACLADHTVVHTKEKNFCCDICGKAFGTKGSMREHRRTHSNVRPFACAVCGQAFKTREHYKTHFKIHMREQNKLEQDSTLP